MLATLAAPPAHAATEIQWWHAMSGELGPVVEQLATDFNAQQGEYRIIPEYKGQYTQTMTAALFAMRSSQHPAIVQVNEVATATMMAAKGATYPVFELMREQGVAFDPSAYLPAVAGYYTDASGQHAVVPVQRLDADPLLQQGPVPPRRARSRGGAAHLAGGRGGSVKLLAAGMPCGFTTAWPSWVHVENLSAVHDLPIATRQNGFGGLDTELTINHAIAVRHLTALAAWQKTGIFDYGGRADRADAKFHGSQCGMYVTSSATRPDILANAKFEVGYGLMPYWPDGCRAAECDHRRRHAVGAERPAGGRIPAASRDSSRSCPGPRSRRAGTRGRGYLPITRAAYELSRRQGFYEANPGHRHLDPADHPAGTDTRTPRGCASARSCWCAT